MKDLVDREYAESVIAEDIELQNGHEWYLPYQGIYHGPLINMAPFVTYTGLISNWLISFIVNLCIFFRKILKLCKNT